jgi:imidazolonepropionase-like amidohydrolase
MVDWLGMSPMEAITSATQRASECIERPDLGALKAGCKADILIVNGDPVNDITVLQDRERLRMIMKDGIPVIDKMRLPPIGTPIERRRTK